MNNILACGLKGLKEATARPKMVCVLWLANILAAFPLYLLFSSAFGGALGESGLAGSLASKTDMNVIFEVLTSSSDPLREVMIVALGLIVLYELAAIFLAGGILQTLLLKPERRAFAAVFFGGGGRFYGRFFRLSVSSILVWLPAAAVYLVFDLGLAAVFHDPNRELLGFYLVLVRIAFFLALVFLAKMILDYARIRIAVRDSHLVLSELLFAIRFVGRRLGRTLGLYYVLGFVGLAALALYSLADASFGKTAPGTVAAGLALTQIFILSRGWLKIAFQAGQLEFYAREIEKAGRRLQANPSPPSAVSLEAAQNSGRQAEKGFDQIQPGVDREAQKPEGQENNPDHRVEEKGQKSQRPAQDEQDQPQ